MDDDQARQGRLEKELGNETEENEGAPLHVSRILANWRRIKGDEIRLPVPLPLINAWQRIATGPLARHARPLEYHQGRLVLGVSSEQWRETLKSLEKHVFERLNLARLAYPVTRIDYQIIKPENWESTDVEAADTGPNIRDLPVDADAAEEIDELVSEIEDVRLRIRLRKFLENYSRLYRIRDEKRGSR